MEGVWRAQRVLAENDPAAARPPVDSVTLASADRHRRRILLETDGGRALLLDLAEATWLRHGDRLAIHGPDAAQPGSVEVRAAPEPVLALKARDGAHLARLAWHLGNRHTPAEIDGLCLYIAPDHVLADLATRLGATVEPVERPFQPEGGAYETHRHDR